MPGYWPSSSQRHLNPDPPRSVISGWSNSRTHMLLPTRSVPGSSPLQCPALGCTRSYAWGQAKRDRATPEQLHSTFLPCSQRRANSPASPPILCSNQRGTGLLGLIFLQNNCIPQDDGTFYTPAHRHTKPPSPRSHNPSHRIPHLAPFRLRRVYRVIEFNQPSTYRYWVQQPSCSKKENTKLGCIMRVVLNALFGGVLGLSFFLVFFCAFTRLWVKGQAGLKTHIRIVRVWAKVDTERLVVSLPVKWDRWVWKSQQARSCQLLNARSKQTGFALQRATTECISPTPKSTPRQKVAVGPATK